MQDGLDFANASGPLGPAPLSHRHLSEIAWRGLAALLVAIAVLGCSKASSAPLGGGDAEGYEKLELRYEGGTGVSFPELAEDLGFLAPLRLSFVGSSISGPHNIQSVVTGDTDFGGAFNGAVIKLFAARAPIKAVIGYYGVDKETWSGFYVLDDSPIKSPRDLIGKKISVNTLGAHSEFILKEYLLRNGLSRDEVNQVTLVVIPPVNGELALRQKQVDVATLGGILRDKAMERGGLHPLFTDHDLFGAFTAGSYVLTKEFIRDNPRTARKFVEAVAKAIDWAQTTPRGEVIARFEKIVAGRGRNEEASVLKYWRSTGVAGKGGLIAETEFQVWIDWLVRDGELKQGQVQLSELYTNEFNPFWKGGP
ncbi:ABC transporter substrate-binding protein [Sorangium sp. So ce321]|uniref:ABC transporter substrate-binding protein n=1 Tax=Sorangium sp. So ce321 TaxID=3133300 RepID=UPI003F5E535E